MVFFESSLIVVTKLKRKTTSIFGNAQGAAMVEFTAVTDEELKLARQDPAFRRQLLSNNLEVLMNKLNTLRATTRGLDKTSARQIREGVDMAVKLSEMLQVAEAEKEPPQAA